MLIEISKNIFWDNEKLFTEQSDECKEFCNTYKENWDNRIAEATESTTHSHRVIWQLFSLIETHNLKCYWIYKFPPDDPNCGILDYYNYELKIIE